MSQSPPLPLYRQQFSSPLAGRPLRLEAKLATKPLANDGETPSPLSCFNKSQWLLQVLALGLSLASLHLHGATLPTDRIILDKTTETNLRIELVAVSKETFEEVLQAPGLVEVLPGRRAVISSRIAGRAIRVLARPDHEVLQGEPLIEIESRLPGDPPARITLDAPITGLVTDLTVVPGQPVEPVQSLLAIVNLAEVYGIARVPEHHTSKLRPGMPVRIRSSGWPGDVWETNIEHLGAVADPASGTIEVACYIENAGIWLRPGMRLEFAIVIASRPDVTVVPLAAVQGNVGSHFVLKADPTLNHAYIRTPVVVGQRNDTHIEIISGLSPKDRVVSRGAQLLGQTGQATLSLKEALDAAHGHAHNEDGSEITPSASNSKPSSSKKVDDHGHSHDSSHGHSHTHDANGTGGSLIHDTVDGILEFFQHRISWTAFFATLCVLQIALLILALHYRRNQPAPTTHPESPKQTASLPPPSATTPATTASKTSGTPDSHA